MQGLRLKGSKAQSNVCEGFEDNGLVVWLLSHALSFFVYRNFCPPCFSSLYMVGHGWLLRYLSFSNKTATRTLSFFS
jgi:hypothetical protein